MTRLVHLPAWKKEMIAISRADAVGSHLGARPDPTNELSLPSLIGRTSATVGAESQVVSHVLTRVWGSCQSVGLKLGSYLIMG